MSKLDFELSDFLKRHWWKIIFIPLFIFKLLELQFNARVFTILFKFWLSSLVVTPLMWGFGVWLIYAGWQNKPERQAGFIIGVSIFLFIPAIFIIISYTFF
jgi:hypothetical protein